MTSDFKPEVDIWPFRACAMHPAIIIRTVRSLWNWLWGRYHVPQNVFLVINKINKSYTKYRKKKKKEEKARQERAVNVTQITVNVREVTNSERVKQSYQSVSKQYILALDQLVTWPAVTRLRTHNSTVPRMELRQNFTGFQFASASPSRQQFWYV